MFQSRIAYSLLMVIAAVLATWLVLRRQAELAVSRSDRWTLIASVFVGATFAAKLSLLFHTSESHSPLTAWFGDLTFYQWSALVIGAAMCVILRSRVRQPHERDSRIEQKVR